MSKSKKALSTSKFLVGAGVAAAAAAGVVAFLTQTKKGQALAKKGREHAKEISTAVAKRAENMKELSKAKYEELIDDVTEEYKRKKKITKAAAEELATELKKEWKHIHQELKKK